MKLFIITIFFIQTLFSFEVKDLKKDFFNDKYHIYFSIDENSTATIKCEDKNISLNLQKGKYDIALECSVTEVIFDKAEEEKKRVKNSSILNIIYPKERNVSRFILSKPLIAIKVPKSIAYTDIIQNIANKRVVFIGERHDKYSHHLNQLKIIKTLYRKNQNIAIGMEMFQRKFQPYINDYLNNKIDEKTFLKKSQYKKRWGFDYQLYKPIIEFAKKEQIPIVALNLEREITKKISKEGLFSLSKDEMKKIPNTIDFSNIEYKNTLLKFFSSNRHSKNNNKKTIYFYQAQLLWDQTMAESINNYLKHNPNYQMVVLAGNGHLKMRYGIPNHVPFSQSIILQDEDAIPNSADYILYTDDDIDNQSSK